MARKNKLNKAFQENIEARKELTEEVEKRVEVVQATPTLAPTPVIPAKAKDACPHTLVGMLRGTVRCMRCGKTPETFA